MAENNWLLNDSAPVPLGQEFSAAASAKSWGWFGLPAAGQGSEFEAAATPSAETPWTPAELAFNAAEAGGGGITATAAITEADDTGSASAALAIGAVHAGIEADDILAAAAVLPIAATAAVTEADDTLAASATVGDPVITASAEITEADDTGSASAALAIGAVHAGIEADDILVATAQVTGEVPEVVPAASSGGGSAGRSTSLRPKPRLPVITATAEINEGPDTVVAFAIVSAAAAPVLITAADRAAVAALILEAQHAAQEEEALALLLL